MKVNVVDVTMVDPDEGTNRLQIALLDALEEGVGTLHLVGGSFALESNVNVALLDAVDED
jgi:hypothetical protein